MKHIHNAGVQNLICINDVTYDQCYRLHSKPYMQETYYILYCKLQQQTQQKYCLSFNILQQLVATSLFFLMSHYSHQG